VKMSGFPESPRALVITATALRSLAKLSGVPSNLPDTGGANDGVDLGGGRG